MPDDVTARGAHALTIEDGRVRIETVADTRGDRPWASAARKDETAGEPDDDSAPPGKRRR